MYKILLAEDEKWVRIALRKTVEKLMLPVQVVYEAPNGLDALDWLRANEAELVLTDIRMPVMDGLTLLKEVKENGLRADLIIVSGHDDFTYAQQALRQGATDYLLKPVEAGTLEDCVRRWMKKREDATVSKGDAAVNVKDQSPVEQVIHHILTNRLYAMTSAEAAAFVHLNPSYFSKLFKHTTSMTFTDYVTMLRMKEAAKLLETTSLRVTEIADRMGYTDPAYFSNTFKKTIGTTPKEYRKRPMKVMEVK